VKTPERAVALTALALIAAVSRAAAATFTVTSTSDAGAGSLREAVLAANANPGPDTITFALFGDIQLNAPLPLLASDLTIKCDLPHTAISGFGFRTGFDTARIFETAPGYTIAISGLTLKNATGFGGSAILNRGSNLTVQNCFFQGNVSFAIKNTADAGQTATLDIRDCQFVNLWTASGIDNSGPGQQSVVVTNCSFLGYEPEADGALIRNGGNAALINCTIALTTYQNSFRAIHNQGAGARMDIRNCTLVGESQSDHGPLLHNDVGIATVVNTIFKLAGNATSIVDALGDPSRLQSLGHNISSDRAGGNTSTLPGGYLDGPGDRRNTNPLLDIYFINNGGPTTTYRLLAGSPAINRADPNQAPVRDGRDFIRHDAPDIGAYESGGTIPACLGNISTRALVGTGDDVLIAGCIVRVSGQPNPIAFRGIGPSLPFGGALADPKLEVHEGDEVVTNDNWEDGPDKQQIINLGLAPSSSVEAAMIAPVGSTSYGTDACTAILSGTNNSTGIGLVELYDLDRTNGREPSNISTRAMVQAGDGVMIAGFIVLGPDSLRVAVRAMGPSYVSAPLQDPAFRIYDQNGAVLAENDNWRTGAEQQTLYYRGLAPAADHDAADIVALQPGTYTAIVRGVGDSTGVAVVELYRL
jgi:hypothetical protein